MVAGIYVSGSRHQQGACQGPPVKTATSCQAAFAQSCYGLWSGENARPHRLAKSIYSEEQNSEI